MIVDEGQLVMEPCPTCSSTHTAYDAVFGFWKCEDCSGVWGYSSDDPDYDEAVEPCPVCGDRALDSSADHEPDSPAEYPAECPGCGGSGYVAD